MITAAFWAAASETPWLQLLVVPWPSKTWASMPASLAPARKPFSTALVSGLTTGKISQTDLPAALAMFIFGPGAGGVTGAVNLATAAAACEAQLAARLAELFEAEAPATTR